MAVDAARNMTSSTDQNSRDNSLAPVQRAVSKGGLSSSATSINSSADGAADLNPSGDGNMERLRSRGSEDAISEASSHRRRMSKLFKGRRSRRRKSMQDDSSQPDSNDDVPPVPDMPDARYQSEESLALHKSVPSSLLTEDSDADSGAPARPGISPHHSHAGYLTLSSPLINSETVDSVTPSDATLVDSALSTQESLAPRHANTIDVAATKRGASPVGKLREAFVPTRRSTSPKPASEASEGGRATLGTLFGGKKRETKVIPDTELQASPPPIYQTNETQSASSLRSFGPARIITQIPATPPNLVEAPTTLVTPPTPTTDARPASPATSVSSVNVGGKHSASQSNPNVVVSPSGNMISHRRARSATNPPSKLSNSITAPLTPTIEEVKTPGGTAFAPQSPGFFSSVFSAAQNAANTLSTTIANTTAGNKNKSASQPRPDERKVQELGGEEVISPESEQPKEESQPEKRRLAVETLGSGNLSLAQLGITDSTEASPMSSAVNLSLKPDEASARAEDMAAAQAVSAAYAAEKPAGTPSDRPRSLTTVPAGAASPSRQPDIPESPAPMTVQRQGSIRSRISGGRKRRHRGSSATTGNTIAAAISASTHTLAPQAQATLNSQRLNGTGFAVASSKRNKDFHSLFKSVPEDDYLIEDYSAALQKEILLQGRLYVSEGHLCFSSNILGWVTNLVISFDEVVSVEKKSTAVVFPNAIVIQTLHSRNVFASFLTRDSTYDLIIGIWKISHPNLKSSLNGVALDGSGTGDKTEKAESVGSDVGSEQDSEDEVYDEDAEEEDGIGSFTEAGDGSVAGSEREETQGEVRKASAQLAQTVSGGTAKLVEGGEAAVSGATAAQDFPGAATHLPTDCGDGDQHYDKLLIDTTIPAPLGQIYSLLFGPGSGVFMRKFLNDEKQTDIQLEDDGKGLGESRKSMNYSYVKPLGGGIGPSKTKCNIAMTLEQFNLDKAVTVLCSTQNPDVPSGNIFLVKTRYCLMWGPNNSTRMLMTYTIEWSGKSWLKGPIEKGASDGQMTYATNISAALRNAVAAKTGALKAPPGKNGKSRKRSKIAASEEAAASPSPAIAAPVAKNKEPSWGALDPLRSLLPDPLVSLIDLVFTTQNIMLLLGVLLIYSWFFRAAGGAGGGLSHGRGMSSAQRQVAYEEVWRAEEAELWGWLEERVALDYVHGGSSVRGQRDVKARLVAEGVRDRQVDEAIRVTEEKLRALKGAVRRGREREAQTGTKSAKEEEQT